MTLTSTAVQKVRFFLYKKKHASYVAASNIVTKPLSPFTISTIWYHTTHLSRSVYCTCNNNFSIDFFCKRCQKPSFDDL